MSAAPASQNEYLSKKYIDGIYIPSGLLIVGCLIVKREWVPYAVVLALALSGYKLYSNSKNNLSALPHDALNIATNRICRSAKGSEAYRIPRF